MNYWYLFFFTITKNAQPWQLGTRQFLERDHLMDSFQQKNRSSTPINGSWSVLLDYNRITELLGLAMKKNSTRKKFQKNMTDTPASDNAISLILYAEQHSFKASFLWYSKSVILFLSLFINVQWISYLKIEGKICVQHHPSLIRTSGGSGKTPGVGWAAGCGGTGVVVGGTTTGTGGAGGTAGTMVPVVFSTGTHSSSLSRWWEPLDTGNCSRSVDDCAIFSAGVWTGSCLAFWKRKQIYELPSKFVLNSICKKVHKSESVRFFS